MTPTASRFLRRSFLAGLGTAGAATLLRPLLNAEAQATGPQRLLIIHRPCGTSPQDWFPTTGGVKDWGTTPILSSFDALRSDMVVMKGIDLARNPEWNGDKHGAGLVSVMCPPPANGFPLIPGSSGEEVTDADGKAFTGTGPSVDQELLRNVPALQGTSVGSLQLGASAGSAKGSGPECLRVLSYADFNQALWPETRPDIVFNNVFASVVTGVDQGALDHAKARNKSVLDFITADLGRLQAQVPNSQLPKLESHLAAIRALETQVSGVSASCSKPVLAALPTVVAGENLNLDDVQHRTVAEQQLEIVRSAFLCDITRVATLTFSYGNSDVRMFGPISVNEGHHTLSHGGAFSTLGQIDKFYADITAKFLMDMKNTPDGTGSLLDNTLVVYFSDCCIGAEHSIENNPVAFFGGKSLGLNGGSYLQYTGRTFADLWVETFKRFGYNKTMQGAAQWNLGSLPGLYG